MSVRGLLTVYGRVKFSDGLWKETVLVSGCFGVQCSVGTERRSWNRVVVCKSWMIVCLFLACVVADTNHILID